MPGLRLEEPGNVLFRIKRGLAGYVSYLAACEMNQAFSEYVLYEPILRVLTTRGYTVKCECECPGIEQPSKGDKRKIDFVTNRDHVHFALEVKWAKSKRVNVDRDIEKLKAFQQHFSASKSFLCVFGRKTYVSDLRHLKATFKERGKAVFADFKTTRYGCRMYELKAP